MATKNTITKDIHFGVGGQKCFREAMSIPIHTLEKRLILLQERKSFSIKSVTGRPLGGITRLECAEIETWKSIPEYKATRVYKLSDELIVVVKDAQNSELTQITFISNNYAEIKLLKEELNLLENSDEENLELLEKNSRVNERIISILDAKIMISTPMLPYHHYFVDNSESDTASKVGAKERAFFLENRNYDLLLLFNFE